MKLSLTAVLVLLAAAAHAVDPGTPVTVTLPDGSLVSGVVVSSGAPQAAAPPAALPSPPPPLGFAAPPALPPQTATFVGVPVIPVRPPTPEQQRAFLARQAAEREARRHQVTTPQSDFQFDLQQALDRQARGLPFRQP